MLQIKKLVLGVVLSVILTALLFAALAFAAVQMGLFEAALAGTLTTAAGGVAVFLAAFITVRLVGERGLLHGALLSAIYAFVFSGISLILSAAVGPMVLLVRAAVFVLCGAVAGVLGVSRKPQVRF